MTDNFRTAAWHNLIQRLQQHPPGTPGYTDEVNFPMLMAAAPGGAAMSIVQAIAYFAPVPLLAVAELFGNRLATASLLFLLAIGYVYAVAVLG
jgi:hypothetical protein